MVVLEFLPFNKSHLNSWIISFRLKLRTTSVKEVLEDEVSHGVTPDEELVYNDVRARR